ncbi:MAG: hypothetical protein NC313_03290 [Butyrivibrio sp.]|nr:hypothetical protein [Butyrivibrio sp.]
MNEQIDSYMGAQADYDAAVETKDSQYESMKIRIKFMYEQGDVSYVQLLLTSSDINDALNKKV